MEKRALQHALQFAHRHCPDVAFRVLCWDGTEETFGAPPFAFRLIFRDPGLIHRAITDDPIMALGEGYIDGSFDVEGDLQDVVAFAYRSRNAAGRFPVATGGKGSPAPSLAQRAGALGLKILQRTRGRARERDAQNIRHHYDLGNDFFSLWLDGTMSYSCAYFRRPEDSLEQAQRQKIDHILRKLQLRPGERLLDIGCGWGELIITAARRYGAHAMGVTLSREQYEKTRQRIEEAGLEGQVEVALEDYRNLTEDEGAFDKVVSVGMFEHVGQDQHRAYMEVVSALLKPGGLSLLHTITQPTEEALNPWLSRYIFPGGYVPSLREITWLLPEYDFHLLDVESLRLHYALTLEHWARRFDERADAVARMFDERFVRMWRLYLRSCAASFRWSGLNIHQLLFSKGLNNELPLTRAHVYGTDERA